MTRLMRLPVFALLLSTSAVADEIYSQLNLIAAAEPVPVEDMVSGWDGPFQAGEYAWADARMAAGYTVNFDGGNSAFIEWQQRWHYDLQFSKGMSRYYRAIEQGLEPDGDQELMLDARTLQAQGLRTGASWQWRQGLQIRPTLALYQVNAWQFGHLAGQAYADGSASAKLDYHYDQDRILEYQVDPDTGMGISLDLGLDWQIAEQARLHLDVQDLWNYWRLENSGYTNACINLDQPASSVCSSSATASGKSGQDVFIARLRPTLQAGLELPQWRSRLQWVRHNRYQLAGAETWWQPENGPELALNAWSSGALGLAARWQTVQLELSSDDVRPAFARELQARIRFGWRW